MLNRLQAASRLLIRASLALFTAIVLLLIQSAFWSNRVSAWMQAIILATALLSYFRPQYGLLALAVLAPLGQVGSRTLDSRMRGAEALALAFLAGALLRGWTLREFRSFPANRLETAAVIFGFVVAASCAEQIWLSQIRQEFAWPFAQVVLSYASRNYITSFRGFGPIFNAMLLLEGMALLIYTARYVRASAEFTRRLVIMLIFGAVATAMLTFTAAAAEFERARQSAMSLGDFVAQGRWSGHIADVNAAGSYFAMMALLALGVGLRERERRWVWIVSGAVLLLTTLMTGSRTAALAVGLVGVFIGARAALSHSSYPVRALSAAGVVFTVGIAVFLILRKTGATPSEAVTIRWMFLQTTAGMLFAEPAFGIGIGGFPSWTQHFAPAGLFKLWRPDNAHNNLAQIAGELGLVGLTTFCIVLATSFAIRSHIPAGNPLRAPLVAGLAAFILTWLGGHPLLVPEAAYLFWIALGGVAAVIASDLKPSPLAGVVGVTAAVLLISIPFRVGAKSTQIDLSSASYGVSERNLFTSRARLFVPTSHSGVEMTLRSRGATDDEPVEIDVFVDDSASQTVTLTDRNWRGASIHFSANAARRFRQIDLRVRPAPADTINPARSSVEIGKWEIISKPNG